MNTAKQVSINHHTVPLIELSGRSIVRWAALEMALSDGASEDGSVLWEHESVPYLQLASIDLQLEDGAIYRMLSQSDDGSGYYGLYLIPQESLNAPLALEQGSIFRTRDLNELPVGPATVRVTRAEGPNAIIQIEIAIGSRIVSCRAAEVYERDDGSFRIVDADESILLQIDGARHEPR